MLGWMATLPALLQRFQQPAHQAVRRAIDWLFATLMGAFAVRLPFARTE